MKKAVFLLVAMVLFMGNVNVQAVNLTQKEVTQQMAKQIKKDLKRSFLDEDIRAHVEKNGRAEVLLTVRVDKDSKIKVLKAEGASDEIRDWVKETINNADVKTDEASKYRMFRVPLTLVYRK